MNVRISEASESWKEDGKGEWALFCLMKWVNISVCVTGGHFRGGRTVPPDVIISDVAMPKCEQH
jgi:hypothetical protein